MACRVNRIVVEVLLAIIFCVVLSALLHESYEKWYLRLDKTSTIVLIVFLFVTSCVLVVNNQSIVDQIHGKIIEFKEVEEVINMTKRLFTCKQINKYIFQVK